MPRLLGVVGHQPAVHLERPAAAVFVQVRQDERRHRLALHLSGFGFRERSLDQRLDVVQALGRRTGDDDRRLGELPMPPREPNRPSTVSSTVTPGPPRAE